MKKITGLMTLALVTGVFSCTNDKNPGSQPMDTEVADTTLQAVQQHEKTVAWTQFYEQKTPTFQIDSFVETDISETELTETKMELNETFYQRYGKLLVYNTDSSKFIDLFSYSLLIDTSRQGALIARTGEPDEEAAVVDVKTGTRRRIWFCGPGCQLQQAIWIGERVALLGLTDEDGDQEFRPQIWIVDLKSGNTMTYEYPGEIKNINPAEFTQSWLQEKGVRLETMP